MSAWESAGIVTGVVVGALTLIVTTCTAVVKAGGLIRRVARFLDQWLGHGEGSDRVPGLIERVECLDERSRRVEAQVFTNGGTSLRDAVEDVRTQLAEHLLNLPKGIDHG